MGTDFFHISKVTYWSTWKIDLLNCNEIWFNGQSDSQSVQDTLYDECSWDWWSIDPLSARIAYFEGLYARLLPQDGEALNMSRFSDSTKQAPILKTGTSKLNRAQRKINVSGRK